MYNSGVVAKGKCTIRYCTTNKSVQETCWANPCVHKRCSTCLCTNLPRVQVYSFGVVAKEKCSPRSCAAQRQSWPNQCVYICAARIAWAQICTVLQCTTLVLWQRRRDSTTETTRISHVLTHQTWLVGLGHAIRYGPKHVSTRSRTQQTDTTP